MSMYFCSVKGLVSASSSHFASGLVFNWKTCSMFDMCGIVFMFEFFLGRETKVYACGNYLTAKPDKINII